MSVRNFVYKHKASCRQEDLQVFTDFSGVLCGSAFAPTRKKKKKKLRWKHLKRQHVGVSALCHFVGKDLNVFEQNQFSISTA